MAEKKRTSHKKNTLPKSGKKRNTKGKKKGVAHGSKAVLAILFLLLAGGVIGGILLKKQHFNNTEEFMLYLPTGSDFAAATDSLAVHGCVESNNHTYKLMAKLRKYDKHVKAGSYKIEPQMNMWKALTKLYYGNRDAVRVTINKHRKAETLCDYVGGRLEMTADDLLVMMKDPHSCESYGFSKEEIIGMFIQNTYELYWNTSAEQFMERMKKEYDKFWTDKRMTQCKALNLTPIEVITLASIVEEETNKNDEKPDVASVYLNRLRRGMPLQADPTVKYAVGDFGLRRILNVHTEVESPYNTYKHKGLPPGPICIPSIASIDAVLANKKTDYIYFCARADFSGYHAFASTLAQHNANAAAFHAEMNRRKIYK